MTAFINNLLNDVKSTSIYDKTLVNKQVGGVYLAQCSPKRVIKAKSPSITNKLLYKYIEANKNSDIFKNVAKWLVQSVKHHNETFRIYGGKEHGFVSLQRKTDLMKSTNPGSSRPIHTKGIRKFELAENSLCALVHNYYKQKGMIITSLDDHGLQYVQVKNDTYIDTLTSAFLNFTSWEYCLMVYVLLVENKILKIVQVDNNSNNKESFVVLGEG